MFFGRTEVAKLSGVRRQPSSRKVNFCKERGLIESAVKTTGILYLSLGYLCVSKKMFREAFRTDLPQTRALLAHGAAGQNAVRPRPQRVLEASTTRSEQQQQHFI